MAASPVWRRRLVLLAAALVATLMVLPSRGGVDTALAQASPTATPFYWVQRAPMPSARGELGVVAGTTGRLYAIGGRSGTTPLDAAQEYDPSANSWAPLDGMGTARYAFGLAAAISGKLYAVGGSGSGGAALAATEEYDPAANAWTGKTGMPTARSGVGAAGASNGRIYAIGGRSSGAVLATVEEYNPTTNTWTAKASMPTGRYGLAVAAASNGKLYAIGGQTAAGVSDAVEEYDPATDTWQTRARMLTARAGLAVAPAGNGKLYAVGGFGSAGTGAPLATVEEYDPPTNRWSSRPNLPTGRYGLGAAAGTNAKLYAVGGVAAGDATVLTVDEVPLTFDPAPTVGPSATPGHTATPEATGTPAATGTPLPTGTATPSATPTPTPGPSSTPTGTATASATSVLPTPVPGAAAALVAADLPAQAGGQLLSADAGISIIVPPAALRADVRVGLVPLARPEPPGVVNLDTRLGYATLDIPTVDLNQLAAIAADADLDAERIRVVAGTPYDVRVADARTGRELRRLPALLMVGVNYRLDDLPRGASEFDLRLGQWDEITQEWLGIASSLDRQLRRLHGVIDRPGVTAVLAAAPVVHPLEDGGRYFPLTNQAVTANLWPGYVLFGGLARLGHPITPEQQTGTHIIQLFEKGRLELDLARGLYNLGNVGEELLAARRVVFPADAAPEQPLVDPRYFPETARYVGGPFLAHYVAVGGPDVLGPPISPELTDEGRTVQYFRKGRLDFNAAAGRVEYGSIGSQLAAARAARGTP